MEDYEDYKKQLFNSQQKFYPTNSNFNVLSDLESDDILSYNDFNLNRNFLQAELYNNNPQKRNPMIQNRNRSNNNYINNKLNLQQMQNINQRKEYQINQPNIKPNMGLNARNQRSNINNINMNLANNKNRQNLIYNNNMMNKNKGMNNYMEYNYNFMDDENEEEEEEGEDEDGSDQIIYIYHPKYQNNQNKLIQNKNYINDGKRMINNNQINNTKRNNANMNMNLNMINNANNRFKNVNIKNGNEYNKNNIFNNQQNFNNNGKMMNPNNAYAKSAYSLNIKNLIQNNNINNNMRNVNRPLNPKMPNMQNTQNKNNNFNNNNILRNRQNDYYINIPNKRTNQFGHIANNNNINQQYLNHNRNITKNQPNMNRRIINENIENDEDINLSNIAEDLIEVSHTIKKDKKLDKNKIKNNGKSDINIEKGTDYSKRNNNFDIPLQISSKRKQEYEKFDFGCQTLPELEETPGKNNNIDQKDNDKEQNNIKPKVEKVEIGTDVQASLLKFIEPSQFKFKPSLNNYSSQNENNNINEETDKIINEENNNNINKEKDNNINEENNNKINEEKIIEKNENEQKDNKNEYLVSEASESPFQQNEKEKKEVEVGDIEKGTSNIKVKESLILNEDINDDFGKYIDDDDESERELDAKNIKEKRHIKIDLDQNNYFNFLKGDLIKYCQIRRGINGTLEQFITKEERKIDIFKTDIFLEPKSAIKKYNKNDIKIDENYILCENLTEEQIIPDLYEESIIAENDVNEYAREMAASLRGSIDKSTNSSINNSIRQSITESIYDSIHGSNLKNSTGKGILGKLNQFYGSKNLELIEEN